MRPLDSITCGCGGWLRSAGGASMSDRVLLATRGETGFVLPDGPRLEVWR